MRLTLLTLALVFATGMALTQHVALLNYWYWTYPWLDLVMHFSGGSVLTIIGMAFLGLRRVVLVYTMCVGLLWELYEYVIGVSLVYSNFVADFVLDVSMDLVGALVVYGMMALWLRYGSRLTAERDASPDQTSS